MSWFLRWLTHTLSLAPSLAHHPLRTKDSLFSVSTGHHSVKSPSYDVYYIVMSGDYRSKKEVAYILVPSVGRKVIDLGENLEKGDALNT